MVARPIFRAVTPPVDYSRKWTPSGICYSEWLATIRAETGKENGWSCSIRCPHMNEITLEDTLNALEFNEQIIEVPEDIRVRALKAVERMLEIV